MINELYILERSLERNNISIPQRHPWLEGVKKGEALLVNVTPDGSVEGIEYCSPDHVSSFWNIRESNKQTFPKINLDPLWAKIENQELLAEFVESGKAKQWDRWLDLANTIVGTNSEIKCRETLKKIKDWKKDKWQRLFKFPQEVILPYLGRENERLRELILCFSSWQEFSEVAVNDFLVQIVQKLLDDLSNGRLDCFKLAQDLIAGRPTAKSQPQLTVIFNCSRKYVVVADQSEAQALSAVLSATRTAHEKKYKCPLSGAMTDAAVTKYPSPKLPVIGNTFLMAMNKDTPCHNRYRKNGVRIFPASEEVSSRLDSAIRFITDPGRLYKTWMPVASGKWEGKGKKKKEKKDLLIAFADDLPDIENTNPNLALIMGGDSQQEQSFETVSSIVCDALKKHKISKTSAKLHFFVIRRISKGQSQIVLNEFCLFSQLVQAVEAWKAASSNHSLFSVFLSKKKGVKATEHFPPVPYPADLTRLLQHQWIRDGMESRKLQSCSLVTNYDLFFERGARTESAARLVLQLLLQRLSPLLTGIGRAQQIGELDKYIASALMAVSFLGIVLYKLGIMKEVYMKEVGYNIGRLLSLTDCLHKEYCKIVRNDDIPNQLLGNTILRTVLDSPVRGLARLSERIPVYTAWIDRQTGEEFKLAHWAKNEMGKISEQLSGMDIPDSTDDALKAQILLGYLAHTEIKQK
ncbi:MAG: hypothetical protein B1H13_04680 [Desulfobacteraceae bacterium 4484_190.3]|nr:MAG: hypothetical protein B1H13_04680 [Desulfobacteraceae bacterium 4484_190.3]